MKRIYITLFVTCMLAASVHALPAEWQWWFMATPNSQDPATIGRFGVGASASDGFDGQDLLLEDGAKGAYFGTYRGNANGGWSGPSGFYSRDIRGVLPQQMGASQEWLFYVWASPALDAAVEELHLVWYCLEPRLAPPPGLDFRLTLVQKPQDVQSGPTAGTSWDLTQLIDHTLSLPAFRTEDGLTGYVFSFTATVVPEPSSLLALTGGMGLLAGVMRRRRG